jgi:hypothetical protein
MWVTHEKAKGMWCPFARTLERDSDEGWVSANRAIDESGEPWIGSYHMCLADGCMAWRERKLHGREPIGHCGLAGKPELMAQD